MVLMLESISQAPADSSSVWLKLISLFCHCFLFPFVLAPPLNVQRTCPITLDYCEHLAVSFQKKAMKILPYKASTGNKKLLKNRERKETGKTDSVT